MLNLILSILLSASDARPLKVVVDPGHGGSDSGATYGKAREADIALKVAEQLQKLLHQDQDFQCALTRTQDEELSLKERTQKAKSEHADLLVSIHANAATDKKVRGLEIYFQNQLAPNDESLYLAATENQFLTTENTDAFDEENPSKKSDVLATVEDLKRQFRILSSEKLSRALLKSWDPEKKSGINMIRQAPFYVVSKAHVPSVLVELGFLSNPSEASRLMDPTYQAEIAHKLYAGLVEYKSKFEGKSPESPTKY